MSYVLKHNTSGRYVAQPGQEHSYTTREHARIFKTREEAERERCIESEHIIEVDNGR